MVVYADFHIHSKYARAVSPNSTLENLAAGAAVKGLGIIGTGDFTHPKWFDEIRNKLQPAGEGQDGLYTLRGSPHDIRFMLTTEVATFDSFKRVHHIIHVETMDEAKQLNDVYGKRGNLAADGRPMFGRTSSADLVEMTKQAAPRAEIVSAHAWTPYFGVLGDKSGFNSVQEAYGDQAGKVLGIETGMSSTPSMNWRVSSLDKFAIMSNSDPHSPQSWRIGRECNAFSDDCNSFKEIFDAVRRADNSKFLFTVETAPEYGRYHWDGHRGCNFSSSPQETQKVNGICPVCKKKLTIGVDNRVEKLADRPVGFQRKNAIPFKTVLPLAELIVAVYGGSLYAKGTAEIYQKLIAKFGNEFTILFDASEKDVAEIAGHQLARVAMLNRENKIKIKPGYDGEYGVLQLPNELIVKAKRTRKTNAAAPLPVEGRQVGLGEF